MKLELRKEKYNRLLRRKELDVFIDHTSESTPAMAAVQQLLAKELGAEVEKTEIRDVITARGVSSSVCRAFIWDERVVPKKEETEKKEAAE